MAWHREGDKPLTESILINTSDTYGIIGPQ